MCHPQRAWSRLCPSLCSGWADPPVSWQRGLQLLHLPGWECAYRPLTRVGEAGGEAETGPLGIKTSKRILIQLEKVLLSSEFPKLAGCYEHLASFLGDRCGIDLDLKLIDMHTSRQTPVSPTCREPGKPGHHLLPFHSADEGFQGVYSGCKMLFFLSWS